jgi:predicted nucleic acid-binding protein
MKSIDPGKRIILDADVIIHFCKGEVIGLLPQIFKNKIFIPDIVYEESLSRQFQVEIDNLLKFKMVSELTITTEREVLVEYNRLRKMFGNGESACMAYCRFHDDVIGSSNLKDIKKYCETYNIIYLTTMDFLAEAFRTGLMDEAACDYFIYKVKLKKSRLPFDTIREFLESH